MDYAEWKKGIRRSCALVFTVLTALLFIAALLSLMTGSVPLSPREVLGVLLGSAGSETAAAVVLKLRLPRLLLGLLLGGALAVSGYLLQTFFDNPIAGPYVLGISSGAKLTVAAVLVFFPGRDVRVSSAVLILAAFAGALAVTGIILLIARRTDHIAVLLLAGIMVGYICSAVSEFVITFAEDADIVNLHGWSLGSFASANMGEVAWAFAVVLSAGILLLFLAKPIGALTMGEVHAAGVGVNIRRLRIAIILLSGLLSATVTAFAGPVSFVGIAVPILMRKLLPPARPLPLMAGCFCGGAFFCVACDLIARSLFAPLELLLSTVTSFFGAPVVIAALLARQNKRGGALP